MTRRFVLALVAIFAAGHHVTFSVSARSAFDDPPTFPKANSTWTGTYEQSDTLGKDKAPLYGAHTLDLRLTIGKIEGEKFQGEFWIEDDKKDEKRGLSIRGTVKADKQVRIEVVKALTEGWHPDVKKSVITATRDGNKLVGTVKLITDKEAQTGFVGKFEVRPAK